MSYLYSGTVRSWQGTALRSTSVTVYTDAGGTTPASLTDSGGTPIANPTTTDDRGRIEVYSTSPTLWYKVAGDTRVMRLVRFNDLVQAVVTGTPYLNVMDPPFNATGDGSTDDTAALQAAFTAGENGFVMIPPGTYRFSDKLTLPSDIHIMGSPGQSVLSSLTSAASTDWDEWQGLWNSGGSNIHISGLVGIFPDPVTEVGGSFVHLYNVSNFSVENCICRDGQGGITAEYSDHGRISHNVVSDGIIGINAPVCTDVIIDGNSVNSVRDEGIAAWGVAGQPACERIVISDNIIDACGWGIGAGVSTSADLALAKDFAIRGNVVTRSVNGAFHCYGTGLTVDGNSGITLRYSGTQSTTSGGWWAHGFNGMVVPTLFGVSPTVADRSAAFTVVGDTNVVLSLKKASDGSDIVVAENVVWFVELPSPLTGSYALTA